VTQFVPIHRLSRHLVVYAPGAMFAVCAGGAAMWRGVAASRSAPARYTAVLAGFAALVLHLSFNWQGERIAYAGYHRIKDTYARIRSHLPPGTRVIVGDPGDLCFFDFWLNPLGREAVTMAAFARFADCGELPAGVLLTRANPGWDPPGAPIIQETVARLPCLADPPASWQPVYRGYPEQVYLMAGGDDAQR
jgi:hypothetical protein